MKRQELYIISWQRRRGV